MSGMFLCTRKTADISLQNAADSNPCTDSALLRRGQEFSYAYAIL